MTWLVLSLVLAQAPPSPPASTLTARVQKLVAASGAEVAVVMKTVDGRDEIRIDADKAFHAASTMKIPIMIELFRQAEAGTLSLDEPLLVQVPQRALRPGIACATRGKTLSGGHAIRVNDR